MTSKKTKRVVSYCPIEIQNRINMKESVLNSLEEHVGTPEDVLKTFPNFANKFISGYQTLLNIAREYELNIETRNLEKMNYYNKILRESDKEVKLNE